MRNTTTSRPWRVIIVGLGAGHEEHLYEERFHGTESEAAYRAVELIFMGDRAHVIAI